MKLVSRLSKDGKRRLPAIDRSLLEPIGELSVNFALLEETLRDGIGVFLFFDNQHEYDLLTIITSQLNFGRTIDLLLCLYRSRYPDCTDESLESLCKEASKLEQRRNEIIHAHWGKDMVTGESVRLKNTAKRILKRHSESMSAERISAVANQMAEVAKRLEDCFQKYNKAARSEKPKKA